MRDLTLAVVDRHRLSQTIQLQLRSTGATGESEFELGASILLDPGRFEMRSLGIDSDPLLAVWAGLLDARTLGSRLRETIEIEDLCILRGDFRQVESERIRCKGFLEHGAELYLQFDLPHDRITLLPRPGWNDQALLDAFTRIEP